MVGDATPWEWVGGEIEKAETRRMETRRESDFDLWIMLVILQIGK
jgi:hypothetical protein